MVKRCKQRTYKEVLMKKEDLSLEEVCKKLWDELDENTDGDLQTYIIVMDIDNRLMLYYAA